ncbi:uncharacterized protein LOC143797694 [Ranitomeya variabilis]|uniref:uncharacterized protein LOC143797694 n=1 Tax=Ranitomeya variabilis TaxID=490064 RepID=UPI0040575314
MCEKYWAERRELIDLKQPLEDWLLPDPLTVMVKQEFAQDPFFGKMEMPPLFPTSPRDYGERESRRASHSEERESSTQGQHGGQLQVNSHLLLPNPETEVSSGPSIGGKDKTSSRKRQLKGTDEASVPKRRSVREAATMAKFGINRR